MIFLVSAFGRTTHTGGGPRPAPAAALAQLGHHYLHRSGQPSGRPPPRGTSVIEWSLNYFVISCSRMPKCMVRPYGSPRLTPRRTRRTKQLGAQRGGGSSTLCTRRGSRTRTSRRIVAAPRSGSPERSMCAGGSTHSWRSQPGVDLQGLAGGVAAGTKDPADWPRLSLAVSKLSGGILAV
jgi:hypothetical protein